MDIVGQKKNLPGKIWEVDLQGRSEFRIIRIFSEDNEDISNCSLIIKYLSTANGDKEVEIVIPFHDRMMDGHNKAEVNLYEGFTDLVSLSLTLKIDNQDIGRSVIIHYQLNN